jgi:hypothetical protein
MQDSYEDPKVGPLGGSRVAGQGFDQPDRNQTDHLDDMDIS